MNTLSVSRTKLVISLTSSALISAMALACMSGNGANSGPLDISGNYDVTYDGRYRVTLQIAGAQYTEMADATGRVDFRTSDRGLLSLDLRAFCDRTEVQCPHETFWPRVSIHQPQIRAQQPNRYVLNVIENRMPTATNMAAPGVIPGLVGDDLAFVLALGAGSAGAQSGQLACRFVNISAAGGHFVLTPGAITDGGSLGADAAPAMSSGPRTIAGIADGRVGTVFLGGCAFGALGVGAVLSIETGFTAVRTGVFTPPVVVAPVDPAMVQPGIDPSRVSGDGGTDGGGGDASPTDGSGSDGATGLSDVGASNG